MGFRSVRQNFQVIPVVLHRLLQIANLLRCVRQPVSSDRVVGLIQQSLAVAGDGGTVVALLEVEVAHFHVLGGAMGIEGMKLAHIGIIQSGVGMGFSVIVRRCDVHLVVLAGAAAGILG